MCEVLLVGADGFLGRAVAAALCADERQLSGLVRRPAPLSPCRRLFVADVRDLAAVQHVVASRPFQIVVFLAGVTANRDIVASPGVALEVQVCGVANVLRAVASHGPSVSLFVFASTGKVYGTYEKVPICETTAKRPLNFHGKAKSMAEDVMDFFAPVLPSVRLVSLRIFNVYGPGQDPRFVVPALVRQIREQQQQQQVSVGESQTKKTLQLSVSDPKVVRDFVYIDDLVGLFRTLLSCASSSLAPGFLALNVGSGRGTSLAELIALIGETVGVDVEAVRDESMKRSDEMEQEYGDCQKIWKMLGWKATTPLRQGLEQTIKQTKGEN